jgi:hypothetical protein
VNVTSDFLYPVVAVSAVTHHAIYGEDGYPFAGFLEENYLEDGSKK